MWQSILNYKRDAIRSVFMGIGILFLFVESFEVVTDINLTMPFLLFLLASLIVGFGVFVLDGRYFAGFLKRHVSISSNGFDTKIAVKFGDLFAEDGWKAIGVNDFFDSKVDDEIIANNSLHGHVINTYWPEGPDDWQDQINASLKGSDFSKYKRDRGNKKQYPIGTTAKAIADNQKFLCVALGHTDEKTFKTSATAESLIHAVRGMLSKARTVCANEPLFIPLMGTGLGRVGSKHAIVVDLILVAIFEETKVQKITSSITIVLAEDKSTGINLDSISKDWQSNGL